MPLVRLTRIISILTFIEVPSTNYGLSMCILQCLAKVVYSRWNFLDKTRGIAKDFERSIMNNVQYVLRIVHAIMSQRDSHLNWRSRQRIL